MRGEKDVLRKRGGESDGTWRADKAEGQRGQTDRLRRQERGKRRIGQNDV